MEHIGSLLRAYIERSGCTIYGIAKKAGCNRTTLQKVLSNDRRPSQELVLSLLPFLRLTPSEQTKLLSLLERQACGDRLYEQRRLIARLLSESSAGISLSSLYPPHFHIPCSFRSVPGFGTFRPCSGGREYGAHPGTPGRHPALKRAV